MGEKNVVLLTKREIKALKEMRSEAKNCNCLNEANFLSKNIKRILSHGRDRYKNRITVRDNKP